MLLMNIVNGCDNSRLSGVKSTTHRVHAASPLHYLLSLERSLGIGKCVPCEREDAVQNIL